MQRTLWVERKFTLDQPAGWLGNVLERLHGTIPRLKDLCNGLNNDQLGLKPNGKWSIKEHIGHLYDLEFLHIKRIRELKQGITELTGADMSNKRTDDSCHNERDINELIKDYEEQRNIFLSEYEDLSDDDQEFEAMHPRLMVTMRPIDLACFTAEHDDHHLCSIREICT